MKCHIDIETFSCVDLTKAGLYKYAQDLSTEILCVGYAIDDQPVRVWVPYVAKLQEENISRHHYIAAQLPFVEFKQTPPDDLQHALRTADLYAFNAEFEQVMLNSWYAQHISIMKTHSDQWHCTQAQAACASIPQTLKQAADAMKLTEQKDGHGRVEMMYLSSPKRPTANDPTETWSIDKHTDRFMGLYEYCAQDVRVERELAHALPEMSQQERESYLLNKEINSVGVPIDETGVTMMMRARDTYLDKLQQEVEDITHVSGRSIGGITAWMNHPDRGVAQLALSDLRRASREQAERELSDLMGQYSTKEERNTISQSIKVLKGVSDLVSKATSKLDAMQAAKHQGRLYGMFRYHGANTGRASSQIVQLQNFMRPHAGVDSDAVITALKNSSGDYEVVQSMYDNVSLMSALGSSMRGLIQAGRNNTLIWGDFSQIEARVLAWLAGDKDRLNVFESGDDIYKHAASKMFGVPVAKIAKDSRERFMGKTAELALGYQGGAKAFMRMAQTFNVDIPEPKAESLKIAWRLANPAIAGRGGLWNTLEETAKLAVQWKKPYGTNKILFSMEDKWLCMELPSGRKVKYYRPAVVSNKLTYDGIDTFKRQWTRCSTFGGRLAENAASAIAFDLLDTAMKEAHTELGWINAKIVAHVHDEIVVETPHNMMKDEAKKVLLSAMTKRPDWGQDLPLAAEISEGDRYGK